MERAAVTAEKGAPPGGPYSPAIRHDNYLFVSGQLGIDPATGAKKSGDFAAEVHQVLSNLRTLVDAGGATMASVVKVTVFLTDLADFASMNDIYLTYFPEPRPARSTVQVGLMKDFRIEIDAIAAI